MADDALDQEAEKWSAVGEQIAAGVAKHLTLDAASDAGLGALLKFLTAVLKTLEKGATIIAEGAGRTLTVVEEPALPILAAFVGPIIANMFGSEAPIGSFSTRADREGRGGAARALVDAYMAQLVGDSTSGNEPTDEGAKRLAGAAVHAALEGWFNGQIPEFLGELVPWEWLHFKDFGELGEEIIDVLGVNRLVRRAFTPLVTASATTPMQWFVAKKYRQTLLSEGNAVMANARGIFSDAELEEELSRLGYSEKRQSLLRLLHAKYVSLDDALVLAREGVLDRAYAVQALQNQGFDPQTADLVVTAGELKRAAAIRDDALGAVKAAYVDRRIDDAALLDYLTVIFADDADRTHHVDAVRTMRAVNTKFLSPAETEACIMADILPIAAYRDALDRAGYEPDSATALELLLMSKKDAQRSINEHRRTLDEQKAAAAKQKEIDQAARQAELDEQRRLKAEGPLTAWEHAVVTGLVPLARYRALLAERYDAETVATFTAQAEQARTAYLAQQQKAADAAKRAALHGLNVGQLEQVVYAGILTVAQFRQLLVQQQLAPADADLLAATVAVRLADLTTAKQLRADAAAKAAKKHIDLTRAELLVRRGHKTLAQYQAFLGSLDYDDVSIGAMVDLLSLKIADDGAAQKQRDAVAAQKNAVSISFADLRRAVVLGVATIDDFARFLVEHKFTVDAQRILLAELRDDVASADAAREQRTARQRRIGDSSLSLPSLARAARLGIITIAAYQGHLEAAGYSADDIAIDTDLLTNEIAQARIAAERAAAALAKQTDRGLSLTQLSTAVKLDEATLDDYRGRALSLGYSDDDTQTLVNVLADELAATKDARARHKAIAADLQTRNLSLAQLDAAVLANALTIDGYRAKLADLGYAADDVDLLVSLLELKRGG